jgi:hypothetical protein
VRAFAIRRRRDRQNRVRQTTIQLPEEAVWDLPDGQRFAVERLAGGLVLLSPVAAPAGPPMTATEKRPPPVTECPECGKTVDARGMKNHVAWANRGVVPPWRKATRR